MPINSLSEDILTKIFEICSEADWELPPLRWSLGREWDWTQITHVSKYWRELAISSPFLWRKPALRKHSRDRLVTFLNRSQDAPLTIIYMRRCTSSDPSIGSCFRCVSNLVVALGHLSHIRGLYIASVNDDIIRAMLDKPAPLLELLHLSSDPLHTGVLQASDKLFGSHTPLLKKFVLQGFSLPYNARILRGLEHLEIGKDDGSGFISSRQLSRMHYPTVYELLDILNSSPSLKELHLHSIRSSSDLRETRGEFGWQKIQLPNLRKISLGMININICQILLQNIQLSALASFQLDVQYTDASQHATFLSILQSISDRGLCRALDLTLVGSRSSGFAKSIGVLDADTSDKGRTINSSLSLNQVDAAGNPLSHGEVDYGSIAAMMTNLIRNSYWRNASELVLSVNTNYILSDNQWRALLDPFNSVTWLNMMQLDSPFTSMIVNPHATNAFMEKSSKLLCTVLSALMLPSESGITEGQPEESRTSLILPSLKSIQIFVYSMSRAADHILSCMKARSENGCAIEDLHIINFERFGFGSIGDHARIGSDWHTEMLQYVGRISF